MKRLRITEKYELRRVDDMNMQLYEFREVDTSKSHRYGSEERTEWRATGNFFQTVESACLFVFKRMQCESGYEGDLRGAVSAIERMKDEIVDNVRRAVA